MKKKAKRALERALRKIDGTQADVACYAAARGSRLDYADRVAINEATRHMTKAQLMLAGLLG